jgi:hypothetical protein
MWMWAAQAFVWLRNWRNLVAVGSMAMSMATIGLMLGVVGGSDGQWNIVARLWSETGVNASVMQVQQDIFSFLDMFWPVNMTLACLNFLASLYVWRITINMFDRAAGIVSRAQPGKGTAF